MRWRGKTVLVTGAGAGIGREFARQFHKKGAYVIGASLIQEELDSLRTELARSSMFAVDLTAEGAIEQLMSHIVAQDLRIDAFVNNAGIGLFGEHLSLDQGRVEKMLQLNVLAFTRIFSEVASQMRSHRQGVILNVASTTAFQPLPYLAAYAASKHYVLAFSEAMAQELAPHNVHITTLCPGTTRTAFLAGCGLDVDKAAKGSLSALADKVAMTPRDVAAKGISAMEKKQGVVVPGLLNQAHRWLTGGLTDGVAGRLAHRIFQTIPAK
jgi:short-subunit dehydrogenase